MAKRKPGISFTVSENVKLLYELASSSGGLDATRLCGAGGLLNDAQEIHTEAKRLLDLL